MSNYLEKNTPKSRKSTFFRLYNCFQHYLRSTQCTLSTGAIVLFYGLLGLWNDQRRPSIFVAHIADLQLVTKLSERSVRLKRQELIDTGLIAYIEGSKTRPGHYQIVDLCALFERYKSFDGLIPFSISEDIPGKFCRESEDIPGKFCRESEDIPGKFCRESEEYPAHSAGNNLFPAKNAANSAGNNNSLYSRDSSPRETELFTYRDLFSSEEQKNQKNKKKEEKNDLNFSKNFFCKIEQKWNSSKMKYKVPKSNPIKVKSLKTQLSRLCDRYGTDVVTDAIDYCLSHPWLSGDMPDSSGKIFNAKFDWVLRDDIFARMVDQDFYIPEKTTRGPGDSRPDSRTAQYAQNIKDDYYDFYGDLGDLDDDATAEKEKVTEDGTFGD